MTLQQICVSLELAKQLKEAGYPQESFFWWRYNWSKEKYEIQGENRGEDFAAPTSAELGEQLPDSIHAAPITYFLDYQKLGDTWKIDYRDADDDQLLWSIGSDNEADIRAKMWLLLKEKGLIPSNQGEKGKGV